MNETNKVYGFQVGHRVRVREDLQVDKLYFNQSGIVGDYFSSEMKPFRGKEAQIVGKKNGKYMLNIDNFHYYTDEMLEPHSDAHNATPYIYNEEVEAIVAQMMQIQKSNAIDKALDEKLHVTDPEKFKALTNYVIE